MSGAVGPPFPRKLSVVLLVACGAVLYSGYVALFWQPVLSEVRAGHSLQGSVKDAFLGDQLTYMAISRNVQEGRSAYVEPFTATGSSIYPSGYYWLLGRVAAATDTNPFFAWNVVGIAVAVALAGAAGAWAHWATRQPAAWVLGPLPLLVGTLTWLQNGSWLTFYGQAVLWPGYTILFNPGAEVAGMVLVVLMSLCLAKALVGEADDARWFVAAGALIGLNAHVHTYATLFAGTVAVATLLIGRLLAPGSRRARLLAGAWVVGAAVFAMSGVVDSPLLLLAILWAGDVAPLVFVGEWRDGRRRVLALCAAAGAVALPMAARIMADLLNNDSFLSRRQASAYAVDLSLPAGDVLLATAPVLALSGIALIQLVAHRRRARERAWGACVLGALVGSVLLTFNHVWGMNQEPYRFYPYSQILLAVLSVPWLYRAVAARRQLVVRGVLAVGLVATIPSTKAWSDHHVDRRVRFTEGERAAFAALARAVPRRGLALVDTCIPRQAFKVLTETNVVDYNPGLAVPARRAELARLRADQRFGVLSSGAELRAAGVTNFITLNYCHRVDRSVLVQRFGEPISTVRPSDAVACGMPRDTAFEVYRTDGDTAADNRTDVPAFDRKIPHRFRPGPDGRAVAPSSDCAYGFVAYLRDE